MLIRRFFSSAFPIATSPFFCYSTTTTRPNNQYSKILSTNSVNDLLDLIEQSKSKISREAVGSVSKHLTSLLNDREDRYNYTKLNSFLANINESNPSTFSEKTLLSLLSLLRVLKSKSISLAAIFPLSNDVTNTYISMIRKRKETGDVNLDNLLNGYFQLTSLNDAPNARIVAFKILQLQQANTDGTLPLTNSQVSLLLNTLSLRIDLSGDQRKLRKIVIKRVQAIMKEIKIRDLVKIAVSLARFEQYDMALEEINITRDVFFKLIENIQELEQSLIYELLRGENNIRLDTVVKLYQTISNNVFEQIQENGQTDINIILIKIIALLAPKVPFQQLLPEQKQKLFEFISRCSKNESDRDFCKKLADMVAIDYFYDQYKPTLVRILKENKVQPPLTLLYELAIHNYDIFPFERAMLHEMQSEYAQSQIYKLGIIAHKLASKSERAANVYQKILEELTKQISNPIEFIKLNSKLYRQGVAIPDFHDAFSKVIQQLPNPFASPVPEELPKNYRSHYLSYWFNSFRNYKQLDSFLESNKQSITDQDLYHLVWHYFSIGDKGKQIEINRSILNIIYKIYSRAIQNKDKKGIDVSIQMVDKYHRLVIGGRLDSMIEHCIFTILQAFISNIPLLQELKCDLRFIFVLEKYLIKNYKRYNLENNYRKLIKHMLDHYHFLARKQITWLVLKQGLRLNLITKEVIENVKEEDLNRFYYNQHIRLQYIKDPSFVPTIDKIDSNSLQVIFSNPNLQSIIAANQENIIEIIKKMNPIDLCNMLIFFKQSFEVAANRRVLKQLINGFIKVKSLQNINFMDIFQNLLELNYYSPIMKMAYERVEGELKANIPKYSFQTHFDFIKLVVSQPQMNLREYYDKLLDFVEHNNRLRDWHYCHLLIRLASTNHIFKEKELKQLPKMMEKSLFGSLYFFLMVEPFLDATTCSQFISTFVEKQNALATKKGAHRFNFFYSFYIKKKYPTQTATMNLQGREFFYEKIAAQHVNAKVIEKIIDLGGGEYELVKQFGPQNYIFKIKNTVIIFLNVRKIGSYHEHQFIKRAIPLILGEPLNVVVVSPPYTHLRIFEYINTCSPDLFDKQLYKKTIEEFQADQAEIDKDQEEKAENGVQEEKIEVKEQEPVHVN